MLGHVVSVHLALLARLFLLLLPLPLGRSQVPPDVEAVFAVVSRLSLIYIALFLIQAILYSKDERDLGDPLSSL